MTASEMLADLNRCGFDLSAEGDGIRVTPASRLTAEQRALIRSNRAELLSLLRRQDEFDDFVLEAIEHDMVARGEALPGTWRFLDLPKPPAKPPAPAVPPGVRVFFADEDGKPCAPADAATWTWEGARDWFRAADFPAPPVELTLRADYPKRCGNCRRNTFALSPRTFRDGTEHWEARCAGCGRRLAGWVKPPPGNPDVECRARGASA
jgi:hypothetical protein